MSINRTFELRADSEYIELMQLLKAEQIAQTGGHAKMLIEDETVFVNHELELRKRRKLRKGDIVQIEDLIIEIV
jgi:ribosome-associated protein